MSQIQDPQIANIVYNFLGNTLAQLNEIDKHNVGGSSLKALKTDPKNVFRMNADPGMNLIPNPIAEYQQPPVPVPAAPSINVAPPVAAPVATAVAAPPEYVQNAVKMDAHFRDPRISGEIDKIINALNNIKTFFNEPIHN